MTEERPQPAEPDGTSAPPAKIEAGGGLPAVIESRTMAALCYLSSAVSPYLIFLPVIPLVFTNMKRSAYMRYHAWNALLLSGVVGGARLLLNLAGLPVALSGAQCAESVCSMLSLVSLVLVPTAAAVYGIHLAYEAVKRRPAYIPVLSSRAHALSHTTEDMEDASADT
ncbi:MAG: hypothetical protein J7M38_08320 [Armatimonadetes bacterium]|nr:hypothetical protein [Armatimonadota bacterium]